MTRQIKPRHVGRTRKDLIIGACVVTLRSLLVAPSLGHYWAILALAVSAPLIGKPLDTQRKC